MLNGVDERAEGFAANPLLANLRDHSRFRQIPGSIAYRRQLRMKMSTAGAEISLPGESAERIRGGR
jgi:hypothetical protein